MSGVAGRIIQGFRIDGRTTAPIQSRIISTACRNTSGSNSSMMPISRENLFIIRPTGFVSKNKTGAFNTPDIMELCKCLEEFNKALMNTVAIVTERTKKPAEIAP